METLGQFLKREREARNLSIEEVEKFTKYHRSRIEALEADHHDQLPFPPYVKGMLRSLAKYYSLDITDILVRYQDFLNSQKKEMPPPPMEEIRIPLYKRKYFLISVSFGLFLMSAASAFFLIRRSVSIPPQPTEAITTLPVVEKEGKKVIPPASDKKHRVSIQASKAVWMKVQIDADPPYHFALKEGGSVQLGGNRGVRFFVSDAAVVKLTYNEKEVTETPSGPATFIFPQDARKEEVADK